MGVGLGWFSSFLALAKIKSDFPRTILYLYTRYLGTLACPIST